VWLQIENQTLWVAAGTTEQQLITLSAKTDLKYRNLNPTPSVYAYLLTEHSCQISSWSDMKRRSLKPCPHCRRKVRLSPKTARQRRNSATVAVFRDSRAEKCDSLTFLRHCCRTFLPQCGQAFRLSWIGRPNKKKNNDESIMLRDQFLIEKWQKVVVSFIECSDRAYT